MYSESFNNFILQGINGHSTSVTVLHYIGVLGASETALYRAGNPVGYIFAHLFFYVKVNEVLSQLFQEGKN
jgi:hypothetical protein